MAITQGDAHARTSANRCTQQPALESVEQEKRATVGKVRRRFWKQIVIVVATILHGVWWPWTQFGQIVGRIGRRCAALWMPLCGVARWAHRELKDPVLCYLCVLVGVMSSTAIPTALIVQQMHLGFLPPALSPFAIGAIAAVVCDRRALRRWKRARKARLGDRIIHAYSDGVCWLFWWRRTKDQPTQRGKTKIKNQPTPRAEKQGNMAVQDAPDQNKQ